MRINNAYFFFFKCMHISIIIIFLLTYYKSYVSGFLTLGYDIYEFLERIFTLDQFGEETIDTALT